MTTIRTYATRYAPVDLPIDVRRGDAGEYRAVANWIALPDGVEGDSVSVELFKGSGTRVYTIGLDGVRAWNVIEQIQTIASTTGEGDILIGTGEVPYITQLTAGGVDPTEHIIYPGLAKDVEINAAAGRTIRFLDGDYQITAPLVLTSNTRWLGSGRTNLVLDFPVPPLVGDADLPTNAGVKIQGTLNLAKLNTILTAVINPGDVVIPVLDVGTLQPGDNFIVKGHNPTGQSGNGWPEGDGVILCEMFTVTDDWDGTEDITITRPVQQTHAVAGIVVQAVTPVTNVEISGINLVGDGGTYANGVLVDLASNCKGDLIAGGFSRAIVDFRPGVHSCEFKIFNRGECNAIVIRESTFNVRVNVDCASDGKRTHANGIVRAGVTDFFRNIGAYAEGTIRHMCIGVRRGGGVGPVYKLVIDDCLPVEAIARDGGEWIAGGICGGGYDGGSSTLDPAEFGFGVHCELMVSGIRVPTLNGPASVMWHDEYHSSYPKLQIINRTKNPLAGGDDGYNAGLRLGDCSGWCGVYQSIGNNYALMTRGSVAVTFELIVVDGVGASGGQAVVAVQYEHGNADPLGKSPIIKRIIINNCPSHFRFGGDFLLNPDWSCGIGEYIDDRNDKVWRNCIIAYQPDELLNFVQGELCECFSPVATPVERHIKTPDANSRALYCVTTGGTHDYGFGFMFVAPVVGSTVMCDASEVKIGEKLEWSAGRQAHVNNASTRAFGIATTYKAVGSPGLVNVGALLG